MRFLAKLISFVFHPLFLAFELVLFAYWIDQFNYYISEPRDVDTMLLMAFFQMILFPIVAISVLVGLKMVSGFAMEKREDRIGPLIIVMSFYIWFFVNIQGNTNFPDSLSFVSLGIALSTGIAFFINNFSKISLHTVGAGSFVTSLLLLLFYKEMQAISMYLPFVGTAHVSAISLLMGSIIMAGAVGSARLYLRNHENHEIYGGYIVGIISQIISFAIIM